MKISFLVKSDIKKKKIDSERRQSLMPKERYVLCQKQFGMCFVCLFFIYLAFGRTSIIHTSEIMALPISQDWDGRKYLLF